MNIIKKTIKDEQNNCHNALHNALQANRFTPKSSLGTSPFYLLYGQEAILPPNLFQPSLQLSQVASNSQSSALQEITYTLILLE